MASKRFTGRIASVPGDEKKFGFININTVTGPDGFAHGIPTRQDIFLHQDDCGSPLRPGMQVTFEVVPDQHRGAGTLRAVAATEYIEAELLPPGEEPVPGFGLVPANAQTALAIRPTLAQAGMKEVPEEVVQQVVLNRPMPDIPRISEVVTDPELLRYFLMTLFPQLMCFGTDFQLGSTDGELDRMVEQAAEDQRALGMEDQVEDMDAQVRRFKEVRAALTLMHEEGLVRRDAIIPIKYLPDLFMAAPVWYFWGNDNVHQQAEAAMRESDPRVHDNAGYFCDLFPNQRWQDTFLMFNRRLRTLRHYRGDLIPPHIARRMRRAVTLFDQVVIMTPYLEEAGRDWDNPAWVRSIDPYLVGFKRGVPFMFILARFSDSGTFPLHAELLGDTIEFLRANKQRLTGFNAAMNPYWYSPERKGDACRYELGSKLIDHTNDLLTAFDEGILFDWLRGAEQSVATT